MTGMGAFRERLQSSFVDGRLHNATIVATVSAKPSRLGPKTTRTLLFGCLVPILVVVLLISFFLVAQASYQDGAVHMSRPHVSRLGEIVYDAAERGDWEFVTRVGAGNSDFVKEMQALDRRFGSVTQADLVEVDYPTGFATKTVVIFRVIRNGKPYREGLFTIGSWSFSSVLSGEDLDTWVPTR